MVLIQDQVLELRQQGLLNREIAKKLNLPSDAVKDAARRLIRKGLIKSRIKPIDEKTYKQVIRLRKKNMSDYEIARQIGRTRHSVWAIITVLLKQGKIKRYKPTYSTYPIYISQVTNLRRKGLNNTEIAKALGRPLNTIAGTISRLIKEGKLEKLGTRHYKINEKFFSQWTPKLAYFLGLFAADGSMHINRGYNVSIKLKNGASENKLLRRLAKHIGIKTHTRENGQKLAINLSRKGVYGRLLELGFTPNKTYTLKFPHLPEEHVHHFIRGYFDGDGSVQTDHHSKDYPLRAQVIGASRDCIQGIKDTLISAGLRPINMMVRKLKNGRPFYTLSYCHTDCVKLYKYIYRDAGGLFLQRKKAIFDSFFKTQTSFS